MIEGLRFFSQLDASFISDNYRRRTLLNFQINILLFLQFIYCLLLQVELQSCAMLPIENEDRDPRARKIRHGPSDPVEEKVKSLNEGFLIFKG